MIVPLQADFALHFNNSVTLSPVLARPVCEQNHASDTAVPSADIPAVPATFQPGSHPHVGRIFPVDVAESNHHHIRQTDGNGGAACHGW